MSVRIGTTIKQIIIIGGTIAAIVYVAYELNKRYPLFPKKEEPVEPVAEEVAEPKKETLETIPGDTIQFV